MPKIAQLSDLVETDPIRERDLDRGALTGNWINSNPDTNSIARVKVFETDGRLQLQAFAVGPDGLVDWDVTDGMVFAAGPASPVGAAAIFSASITRRRTNSLIDDTSKQTTGPLAQHESQNARHRGMHGGSRRRRLQRHDCRRWRGWSHSLAHCARDAARESRGRSRTANDGAARNFRARIHARRNAHTHQQGCVCHRAVRDVSGRQWSRELPQSRVFLSALIMAFLSSKTGQFTYFSQQLGERDWSNRNVLDFGGNIGNLLRDPSCTIDEERYWCIDVVRESIERGRGGFPTALGSYTIRN